MTAICYLICEAHEASALTLLPCSITDPLRTVATTCRGVWIQFSAEASGRSTCSAWYQSSIS